MRCGGWGAEGAGTLFGYAARMLPFPSMHTIFARPSPADLLANRGPNEGSTAQVSDCRSPECTSVAAKDEAAIQEQIGIELGRFG